MTTDLDTQIRRAEMSVVESDRRLLRTAQQLAPAARSTAWRAAWIGGAGVAVIASTWLVARSLTRPPPRHRSPPRARRVAPLPPPPPVKSRDWQRAMELGGAWMGSALRSGLVPAGPGGAAAPAALAAGWRWWSRRGAAPR